MITDHEQGQIYAINTLVRAMQALEKQGAASMENMMIVMARMKAGLVLCKCDVPSPSTKYSVDSVYCDKCKKEIIIEE